MSSDSRTTTKPPQANNPDIVESLGSQLYRVDLKQEGLDDHIYGLLEELEALTKVHLVAEDSDTPISRHHRLTLMRIVNEKTEGLRKALENRLD